MAERAAGVKKKLQALMALSLDLARRALDLALANRAEDAGRALEDISKRCGGQGLYIAIMAWIDTYADHISDGLSRRGGFTTGTNLLDVHTGRLIDLSTCVDKLPPEIVWATAITQARTGQEKREYHRLLDELPDDPKRRGAYVFCLLMTIADTINRLPRGIAVLGLEAVPE